MSIEIMQEVWKHAPVDQGTLLVLLALADSADEASRTCYPGIGSLAKKGRLSERQVQYCLKRLREACVITVQRNASPVKTNLYRIEEMSTWRTPRDATFAPHAKNTETQFLQVRDEVGCVSDTKLASPKPSVTSEETSKEISSLIFSDQNSDVNNSLSKSEKDEISEGFEEFWEKVWPSHKRKAQKVACGKKYRAACEGKHGQAERQVAPDELNAAAKRYIASVQDREYLKAPLAWLNGALWEPFLGSVGVASQNGGQKTSPRETTSASGYDYGHEVYR